MPSLQQFIDSVDRRVREAVRDSRFPVDQQELLLKTVERFQDDTKGASAAQPLGLLYLTLRAWRNDVDERAEQLGAFCSLYLCSGDLFDDVEDDDLAGKLYEQYGNPIAVNNAIALMFLSFEALRNAMALEPDADLRVRYLAAFNRVSLLGVGCQHADLLGEQAANTPEEVLVLHQGKTSSVALFMELGALLAGCDDQAVAAYRRAGECLAALVQVLDDVRDIYGKPLSPDLMGNKMTYPLACFVETATTEQRSRFSLLRAQLPHTLEEIRELIHEAGSVERCAEAMESLREGFHLAIASTNNASASHRLLLNVVDTLATGIYQPDPLSATEHIRQPRGGFHDCVRAEVGRFSRRMAELGLEIQVRIEPWHLPYFNYEPEHKLLCYPDVDGLPDEVLPFHVELFDASSFDDARARLASGLETIVAHEMFHHLRDVWGRLTADAWHEEYVANRLMVGYAALYCPVELKALRRLAAEAIARFDSDLDTAARAILERCEHPSTLPRGYELGLRASSIVHFAMLEQLIEAAPSLIDDVDSFLRNYAASAAE